LARLRPGILRVISGGPTVAPTDRTSYRGGGPGTIGGPAANQDSFGFNLDPSDPLEAIAIGATDPTSGMKVAAIMSFGGNLSQALMRPDNLRTAYLNHDFSTDRNRRRTSTTSVFTLADPYFTGLADVNDGVALSSFSDLMSVASGILNLKFRNASPEEIAILGDRSNASGPTWTDRRAVAAHPSMPGFLYRGKCIVQIRSRVTPVGHTIPQTSVVSTIGTSGRNPSGAEWALKFQGGSEAQGNGTVGGETDFWEIPSDHKGNVRASGIAGGQGGVLGISDGTTQITESFFSIDSDATKVTMRRTNDSFVTQGSVYTQNYDATGSGNLLDFWELMMGVFANTETPYNAPYDDASMAGKSTGMEVTSIRILIPTGNANAVPINAGYQETVIAQSETGSKVISLPSTAAIWGAGSWTETLRWFHPIDTNGPGRTDEFTAPRNAAGTLPVGVTQDLSARTVTLALGTFKTPGVVMGLIAAAATGIGYCKAYRVIVRVAPSLQIPEPNMGDGAIAGSPFSYVIPRDDGAGNRYWNCGNLAYGAPGIGGLEVTSIPAGWTWTPATRTLSTSNVVDGDTTVVFSCTNGSGDVTTQSVDFKEHGWTPKEIDSSQRVWVQDTLDPVTVPGAHGATIATITDRYTVGRTVGSGAGVEPTINTAGGDSGTMRVLAYNGSQYTQSGAGSNNSGLVNLFDSGNFTTGSGYFAFYGQTSNTGVERFVQWCNSSGGTTFGYRQTAASRGIGYNVGAGARTVDQSPNTQDTNWNVIEIIKNGADISWYLDGTLIATATNADTNAFDAANFIVAANRSSSVNTPDLTGGMGRQLGLNTLPDDATRELIRAWLSDSVIITPDDSLTTEAGDEILTESGLAITLD